VCVAVAVIVGSGGLCCCKSVGLDLWFSGTHPKLKILAVATNDNAIVGQSMLSIISATTQAIWASGVASSLHLYVLSGCNQDYNCDHGIIVLASTSCLQSEPFGSWYICYSSHQCMIPLAHSQHPTSAHWQLVQC
jgi:hypothetical protein